MIIIDVLVVAFLILGIFVGYKKGLIDILASFVALILSLIFAFLVQIPVSNTIRQSDFGDKVYITVAKTMKDSIENNKLAPNDSSFYSSIVKSVISDEQLNSQAEKVTMFIIKGLSLIVIFVLVFAIIMILKSVLNIVFELPILNSVNKYGGACLGFVKSLIILYIIFALLQFVLPMFTKINKIDDTINSTFLTKYLYDDNLIVKVIEKNI